MTSMDLLLAKVLRKIKPSEKEIENERELYEKIKKQLKKHVGEHAEIVAAGSFAKGTCLKEVRDLDIFVLYPPPVRMDTRGDVLLAGLGEIKRAMANYKLEIGYAEHPYLRAYVGERRVDVVPAFKITHIDERVSSVDRTQLHTQFVKGRLDESGCDEVRLLKKFIKAHGIYGAELKIEGFSGYVCELLIIYYGSFLKTLKEVSKWVEPAIDIKNYHGGKAREFLVSPLVVIDPVDANRNAAAVISQTAVSEFILAARNFLAAPNEKFFFGGKKKVVDVKAKMRERGTEVICLEFNAPKVVEDIIWPQLVKASNIFARQLESEGFRLLGRDVHIQNEKCYLLLEFETHKLPNAKKIVGPPIKFAKDVERFVKAHAKAIEGPWVEENRVVAIERRKYTEAEELIDEIVKNWERHGIPEKTGENLAKAKKIPYEKLSKYEIAEIHFSKSF